MSSDEGMEEMSNGIKKAKIAQNRAKQYLIAFWKLLAAEGDIHLLPRIVASLEKYERHADQIYKQVRFFLKYMTV